MSKSLQDSSFSLSKRYSNWKNNLHNNELQNQQQISSITEPNQTTKPDKKPSKLRTALTAITRIRQNPNRVVGTLYGHRRGHVYFAIQQHPKQNPTFLIEMSTATGVLVREMESGSVRVALECEKKLGNNKSCKLAEEGLWRAYCNGKKCGFASRREIGEEERRIFAAVEPITMGAGVIPAADHEGELLYMRARFERVFGSRDSEAFYMISPDSNGGPEFCLYLLRV